MPLLLSEAILGMIDIVGRTRAPQEGPQRACCAVGFVGFCHFCVLFGFLKLSDAKLSFKRHLCMVAVQNTCMYTIDEELTEIC